MPSQDEAWWRRRASLLTDLQRRTSRRTANRTRTARVTQPEPPRPADGSRDGR